jgi:antitoxin component YwqK of YwqJK toxin-antitoxin module
MNEAWILSPSTEYTDVNPSRGASLLSTGETFDNGFQRASWSGTRDSSGRFSLEGTETHHYPSGGQKYEVTWKQGKKTGIESYWNRDGNIGWQWVHREDQSKTWTHYWPNGNKRLESNWQGNRCHGSARIWDSRGELLESHVFQNGILE